MTNQIVPFLNAEIEIVDANGEMWVTPASLARALGHKDRRELTRLIRRNPEEFEGKISVVNLTTIKGVRNSMVISYHGVIRVAMLSKAPRAIEFRDWAEEVLFQAMTTGRYVIPWAAGQGG